MSEPEQKWYFKVGNYIIPPPDRLSYEIYPQSDLIRIASYDMVGRFVGSAEKMSMVWDTMLESDRYDLFTNIIDFDAQKAWLINDRKLLYKLGSKTRQMDAYVGAMSQEFMNNFMSEFGDSWIWSDISVSFISKNAVASETYSLGD